MCYFCAQLSASFLKIAFFKKRVQNLNFWIWIFLSKNGRFVTHNCFSTNALLKPQFLSCFLVARFLGQVVKKGHFWTPSKKKRILTDNRKALFLVFLCFFTLSLCVSLFLFFLLLFLGFVSLFFFFAGHLT